MSPRKSESVPPIAAIEALVCRDVGRKTQELIDANPGGLADAAAALCTARRVGLITGFFVPRGAVAAPETDGPVGTALLAAALAACGVPTRIAVDTPCAEAVRVAVAAAGGGVAVDDDGNLVVGIEPGEVGRELLSFAGVDGDRLIGQAGFLKEERNFHRVRGERIIKADQGRLSVRRSGNSAWRTWRQAWSRASPRPISRRKIRRSRARRGRSDSRRVATEISSSPGCLS